MAYPYIPGSGTEAFQGISVLLGLMVTFGGSSLFGQAASGLILMYSRTLRVGEYVRFQSSIPPALNEMAILITGRFWGAQFEFWAHRRLAKTAGLPDAIIDAIAEGRRPASMSDDERIVYDFCTELYRDKAVSDASFAAVVKRFGEQGVIDLIAAAGYYSIVSMVLNVDRYPLPPGAALPFPEPE